MPHTSVIGPFGFLGFRGRREQASNMVNDVALILDGSMLADDSIESYRGYFNPRSSFFSNFQNTLSNLRNISKQELLMSKLKMGRKRKVVCFPDAVLIVWMAVLQFFTLYCCLFPGRTFN